MTKLANGANVKKWSKMFNPNEFKAVVIPNNVMGSHWTCIKIDIENKKIQ